MINKIKQFLVENGFTSLLVLVGTVVAIVLGKPLIAAGTFGFFFGRNWEIVIKLYKEHLKEKIKDVVNNIKK